MSLRFSGPEYLSDGTFSTATYEYSGSDDRSWSVARNSSLYLDAGPGYRLLTSEVCGICSTDLARQYLPFPLPQIIGHEIVARDENGQRYVVEINASHRARGLASECLYCNNDLHTHCPERLVLGINTLPGGFGPRILAPVNAAIAIPDDLDSELAVLVEPLAAALHAVRSLGLNAGDRVAVLGPRRLGMLVVAALTAHRRLTGSDYAVIALARRDEILTMARRFGADETYNVTSSPEALVGIADVVIDTTGNPEGLDLALQIAKREVHLKSTHGRTAAGLRTLTATVVDEISIARFPASSDALRGMSLIPNSSPRVAWLAQEEPPSWLELAYRGSSAKSAFDEASAATNPAARFDVVVVDSASAVDEVVRPSKECEIALVRPRGEILIAPGVSDSESSLLNAVAKGNLRVSTTRCGEFEPALQLLNDQELRSALREVITHRFSVSEISSAFEVARSAACMKAVVWQTQ